MKNHMAMAAVNPEDDQGYLHRSKASVHEIQSPSEPKVKATQQRRSTGVGHYQGELHETKARKGWANSRTRDNHCAENIPKEEEQRVWSLATGVFCHIYSSFQFALIHWSLIYWVFFLDMIGNCVARKIMVTVKIDEQSHTFRKEGSLFVAQHIK